MSRAPSMPAPISKDEVEVILRKRSAPKGPPPGGMAAGTFKPKAISSNESFGGGGGVGAASSYRDTAPRSMDRSMTPPSYYRDDRDRDRDRGRGGYSRGRDSDSEGDYGDDDVDDDDYYHRSPRDGSRDDRSRNSSGRERDRTSSYASNNSNTNNNNYGSGSGGGGSDRYGEERESGRSRDREWSQQRDHHQQQQQQRGRGRNDEYEADSKNRVEWSGYFDGGDSNRREHKGYGAGSTLTAPTPSATTITTPSAAVVSRAANPNPNPNPNATSPRVTNNTSFSSSGGIEYNSTTMPVWSHTNMCRLFNFEPLLKATYKELKTFVTQPADASTITRCYIERNRQGVNRLAPVYSLCADLEDGTGRELIVCRKIVQCSSAYYVFSLKHDDLYQNRTDRSRLYIGKLRAISSGSYVLYDSGVAGDSNNNSNNSNSNADAKSPSSPSDRAYNFISREINEQGGEGVDAKNAHNQQQNPNMTRDGPLRKEVAVIHFNNFKRPLDKDSGIRGLEVCIAKVDPLRVLGKFSDRNTPHLTLSAEASRALAERKRNSNIKMYYPFEEIRHAGAQNDMYSDSLMVLHERNSRYDPLSACLVDFHGRANLASVKNFQLIMSTPANINNNSGMGSFAHGNGGSGERGEDKDSSLFDNEEANRYILQCGKSTNDCFNMDYKHPLSMYQAFAICIARFDANLTFTKGT